MPRDPDTYRARRLRQAANRPEQAAWQALRGLRRLGYPVRRQHPIGGYFADFAILNARLVIEIDGSVHDGGAAQAADAERQAEIERLGWRVVRLDAQAALNGDHVFAVVSEALGL